MLRWLVYEHGIEPHVTVFDKSARRDGTFSREDFTYDLERDVYVCPAGKTLTTRGRLVNDGATLLYHVDGVAVLIAQRDLEIGEIVGADVSQLPCHFDRLAYVRHRASAIDATEALRTSADSDYWLLTGSRHRLPRSTP